jgi:hypothetical protein
MNNISTKYIMYQNVPTMHNTHVHQPCTSTSYNVPKDIIHGMYQSHASINISTCASTNMPTMCIHQYANHVHLPICQPCASTNHANYNVISLMICLHHEPITITMYQKSTNFCANQVIPMMYYYQAYSIYDCTKHHHASIPQNDESHSCMPNPPQNMCQSNC